MGSRKPEKCYTSAYHFIPGIARLGSNIISSLYFYKNNRNMKKYRWGILGTGSIAKKFAKSLNLLENAVMHSVGSRDQGRADAFAHEYGFSKSYGSYEAFMADPDLEIVYVSSPHTLHLEHTLLAIKHCKHVICEKPMSINAGEVSEMVSAAVKGKVFLMEALWPPFQPSYHKAEEIIRSGVLGKLRHMRGRFAFSTVFDAERRTYNMSLGGGSLLDIGIYPVMDILRYMGKPVAFEAASVISPTGADESTAVIFRFDDGRLAEAYCSFGNPAGTSTEFNCENGNITLSRGRDRSQHLLVEYPGGQTEEMLFTPPAHGYQFEAAEVMHCLDKGLMESPVVPLSFSLELAATLDAIRKRTGIIYHGRDRE